MRRRKADDAIRLRNEAARNFDRQRIEIVGKTIGSCLHEKVKVALKTTSPALREGASDESSRSDFDLFGEDGYDTALFSPPRRPA